MAVPFEIQGSMRGNGLSKAEVYNPTAVGRHGDAGLLVYTRERDIPTAKILPFLNDTYGSAMNQDGAFGGTPVGIHDGIDNVLWAGSNIIGGKVNFSSGDAGRFTNGTNSVKVDNAAAGDVWQFDKGSNQALSAYTAFSMNVNIDKDWSTDSVSIYGYDTGSGLQVGDKVLLEDYIDENSFDVGQSASIPLTDMNLQASTIDSIRMELETKVGGKSPKFYLDEIQLEETGTPIEFRVTHTVDTRYTANVLVITIADVISGTLANGAGMIPLSYDQILSLPQLSAGIQLRSTIDGESSFAGSFRNIGDFLSLGFMITNALSDGTNSIITLEQSFPDPLIITGPPSLNTISLTVEDDLSGLLRFTALLRGSEIPI